MMSQRCLIPLRLLPYDPRLSRCRTPNSLRKPQFRGGVFHAIHRRNDDVTGAIPGSRTQVDVEVLRFGGASLSPGIVPHVNM